MRGSRNGQEDRCGILNWIKIKIKRYEKIFVNDRIRDLVYDIKNEKIILVLENQIALGVINTLKTNLLRNSF